MSNWTKKAQLLLEREELTGLSDEYRALLRSMHKQLENKNAVADAAKIRIFENGAHLPGRGTIFRPNIRPLTADKVY